jgi:neural Wiskott-Aldrich syndrome protein
MNPRLGPFAVGGGADGLRAPNDGPMPQRPLHQAPGGGASPANRADPGEEAVAKRREAPSRGRQASAGLGAGQLHENIPRKMRAWVPCRVEIRIARAEITNVASGMAGSAPPVRHEIGVTKAMSVRLRAPEGGFFIEQVSPETQWIESQIGLLNDDYASWRWTVTPTRRGKARLQLIVSARTVGADGLAAERALPDQVIEVAVSVNYVRLLTTWGGWVAAAIAGGLLAKFGEGAWALGMSLLG